MSGYHLGTCCPIAPGAPCPLCESGREIARLRAEVEDFKAKWYQSNKNLRAAWSRAEAVEADARVMADACADEWTDIEVPTLKAAVERWRTKP